MIYQSTTTRREFWENTLRGSTRGLDDLQLKRATDICVLTELDGNPCGAWHAAHVVANSKHPCPCAACSPQIRRFA